MVWQQDVIAHEPRFEVPAGKPWPTVAPKEQARETKCSGCRQCCIFCLWFTLSCGPEKCSLSGLPAFFSNSFFPSMENTSEWRFPGHPVICLHCTKLRSSAVVRALASSQQCSCVLVQVAGDPAPKAYEKLLWRSLLCGNGWACCFSLTFKSLLFISLV